MRWIEYLAHEPRVASVWAIAPRRGPAALPPNVTVGQIAPLDTKRSRLRFSHQMLERSTDLDFFFVAQGGPYPHLLLPAWLLKGVPIYQWKAQAWASRSMRFHAHFCDRLVFSSTPGSLPIRTKKARVVGHGVDTEHFNPLRTVPERDLVIVGRVSPKKRVHDVVRAIARCERLHGEAYTLDVVGPGASADLDALERLVRDLQLTDRVRVLGSCPQRDLPDLLSRYRAMVNFATTALDKSALEGAACCLPVITTNPRILEAFPPLVRQDIAALEGDADDEADAIHRVLSMTDGARRRLGEQMRCVVVEHHALSTFFTRILDEIERDRATRLPASVGRRSMTRNQTGTRSRARCPKGGPGAIDPRIDHLWRYQGPQFLQLR